MEKQSDKIFEKLKGISNLVSIANKLSDSNEPARQIGAETRYRNHKCDKCGIFKMIKTNHNLGCYSLGRYNVCEACPPYAKYPEFGGSTTWICLEKD